MPSQQALPDVLQCSPRLPPENRNRRLDQIYPRHYGALESAQLVQPSFEAPTLQESYDNLLASNNTDGNDSMTPEQLLKKKHKQERERKRSIYFVVGFSKIWKESIPSRIKRLAKKHKITGLRIKMAYQKFTNFGEKLNADLNNKVMAKIIDSELMDRKCNCNSKSKLDDGRCFYDGNCRRSMVVYCLKCNITGKVYIGKTQVYLKKRTQQHITDVWKVIESGVTKFGLNWTGSGGYAKADAFAKHFADLCRDCTNSNQVKAKMKRIMTPTILWQGDRIQCMKSSRTAQCKICMTERIEILHRMRTDRSKIMNDNSDIYASCKCASRFHKLFSRIDCKTLRTRITQKKVTSTRHSKQRRSRFSFGNTKPNSPSSKSSTSICSPCNSRASPPPPETPVTPEPASPPNEGFLINVNLFDYQPEVSPVPLEQLTNLERDQLASHFELEQRVYDV